MKKFRINRQAYHALENRFQVNISEDGRMVRRDDKTIAYHIELDEEQEAWIFFRYKKERNGFNEFIMEKKSARCLVYAAFDQVCKFNKS